MNLLRKWRRRRAIACRHEVKLWDWPVTDEVTCLGCNRSWQNCPQDPSWAAGLSLLQKHRFRIQEDRS